MDSFQKLISDWKIEDEVNHTLTTKNSVSSGVCQDSGESLHFKEIGKDLPWNQMGIRKYLHLQEFMIKNAHNIDQVLPIWKGLVKGMSSEQPKKDFPSEEIGSKGVANPPDEYPLLDLDRDAIDIIREKVLVGFLGGILDDINSFQIEEIIERFRLRDEASALEIQDKIPKFLQILFDSAFKTADYMYKKHLISAETLRDFIGHKDTMELAAVNMIKIFNIHYEKELSGGDSSIYTMLRNWKLSHYRTFLEGSIL
ncbi:uncharacterized protein PGTG_06987 [Puccinia graminis f. sp. tritici CRL 75-36-700-3]|uniref:Uncharacterized protein n=1 Tax=Puccinia graminis f. sp. tritici (strain CRL 75-36-700-3 / race SCCL) TaxID=418459 RepID=E3KAY7_PUCGT|nr:uncharacterized protein PGTG_06987 [Puccinia graminis f. sp. tritici CRL 75-36-700-3]EFP81366.1 hypothetical protein PGTG_06987 [Puccinia graminis f. sp. tritici CRL 75-36-700-3]